MSSIIQSSVSVHLAEAPGSAGYRQSVAALDDLGHLAASWRALSRAAEGPMQQLAWATACSSAFAPRRTLHIVTASRGGKTTAIAPLRWRTIGGVRHAVMLGGEELHEPTDLIYRDPEALAAVVSALLDGSHPVILDRLPADSLTVRMFQELGRKRAVVVCRPKPPCPFIPLDKTWLEPERHLNAGRRSDLRRARRRAEAHGQLDVEILSPVESELAPSLEEAFEIEASGWKGEARTALKYDKELGRFYRSYAREACRAGILRLCFLRLGGRRVAMQMAVQCAGGFWLLKIGYEAKYARCSPGLLLMRETIRHAAQQGLRTYEFLGISAPWIEAWTRHLRPCVSLGVYPKNWRGAAALTGKAAGALLRRCMIW